MLLSLSVMPFFQTLGSAKTNFLNGVNIELGKTNRSKALCMMENQTRNNKLCVNKPRQSMKQNAFAKNQ